MMSEPSSPNIRIAMNMVTLPPGTIRTSSGEISTPSRLLRFSATASRKGTIPVASVYPCSPSRNAFTAASTICGSVLKSGCPMPRLMMSRPRRCKSAALARTAKAFSSPMRAKAGLTAIKAGAPDKGGLFGKGSGDEQGLDLSTPAPPEQTGGLSVYSQRLLHNPAQASGESLRVLDLPPFHEPRLVEHQPGGVLDQGLVTAVAKAARERRRHRMGRVDFEDGLGAFGEAPMRRQHLFQLPVGAEIRRDEAGDAVGQAVGGADLRDLLLQRLLEEGEEGRDLAGRLGRRRRTLDERDRLDVGCALAHRLERLAVVSGAGRDPEGVDGVGEQQHFDAAGAKTFELRARGEALRIVAGEVIDRRLVVAQICDILCESPVAGRMSGRSESGHLGQAVAPLRVLIEALLDHAAEMLPHLGEFFRLAFGELAELLHDSVGHALADGGENGAFLNHLARDVERQVGAVDDEADETQPARQDIGVLGDEHPTHVELVATLAGRVEQVERPRTGDEGEHRIFVPPFGPPVQGQRRLVELTGEAAVELGIFLRLDV